MAQRGRKKDPIPECKSLCTHNPSQCLFQISVFEVDGARVKCLKCATLSGDASRIWMSSDNWKPHLKTNAHVRAERRAIEAEKRAADLERATADAFREDAVLATVRTPTPSTTLAGPSRRPHVPSAAEEAMWESIDTGEADFDIGMAFDDTAERQRLERETDNFGIWNANSVIGDLDGDIPILDEQEDEVLAEILQNARKLIHIALGKHD